MLSVCMNHPSARTDKCALAGYARNAPTRELSTNFIETNSIGVGLPCSPALLACSCIIANVCIASFAWLALRLRGSELSRLADTIAYDCTWRAECSWISCTLVGPWRSLRF
eukprot:COSAG02_NODE_33556_length_498_cov_0.824561_2_plen_111_part_00